MKNFIHIISKFLLIYILLLLLFLSSYIISDPFKVIKKYDSFKNINDTIEGVILNADHIATETYTKYYKKNKYDSFIFGNSRSFFYILDHWKRYLRKNSVPFCFGANAESIYGINMKLKYINNKSDIRNALILLDFDVLSQKKGDDSHLFILSPKTDPTCSIFKYHLSFFKAYLSLEFLISYYTYKITGKYYNFMGGVLSNRTNGPIYEKWENEIAQGMYYNDDRMNVFYTRSKDQMYSKPIIDDDILTMLYEIKKILDINKTKYKIVINPLYNQKKLNISDLQILKEVFGSKSVFDFSGINNITNDYYNYYEDSHYRTCVADTIMNIIYK